MATTLTRKEREAINDEHHEPEVLAVLEKQITFWQRFGASGWVAFLLAVAVIVLRPGGPFPYPIVYDPDGRLIWHGVAATAREERFIDVRLVEWVRLCRSVTSDEPRFVEDRESCAAMVTGKAVEKFSAYNKESTAIYKDKQRRVLVQVHLNEATIVRLGNDRVQIAWPETWTPEFGYGSEEHRFQANITHAWYAKPSGWSLDRARLNPSRVYVTDYFWGEVKTEGK